MSELTRRSLLRGAAIVGPLVAAGTALATNPAPIKSASVAVETNADAFVMIIRHAEKPADAGQPYGVNAEGVRDDESLTVRGWARAGALVELFDPVTTHGRASLRTGLQRPQHLYAPDPSHGSARSAETITPLSQRLGITVDTALSAGKEKDLARELDAVTGAVLVAWEHQDIPTIVQHLGAVTPAPPAAWPDDRFDVVWCFTRKGDAWVFSQVPQLLLAGDRSSVI